MLYSFLNGLPPPICLIAHNGHLYGFPLLKAEMENIGTTLNRQTMCEDSHAGIQNIFKERDEVMKIQDVEIEEAKQTEDRMIIEDKHGLHYLVCTIQQ